MSFDFNNRKIKDLIFDVTFGLEKECLRVDENGFLANTEHGFDDKHIERDFCENQVEFVTDVFNSAEKVCDQLRELHSLVQKNLANRTPKELLWSFSNPPYVKDENDVPIANFVGGQSGKSEYRKYLADKYGKLKMLYSGIHFNFSFDDSFLTTCFEENGKDSFEEYKNSIYLELAEKLVQYSWLIVYLTASSPVLDRSFIQPNSIGKTLVSNFSSARCSEAGYWNDFVPILAYGTTFEYVESIQRYVESGQLRSASELYYPIRLKPRGLNSLDNLRDNGINHIELRMLDLNPLSEIGIMENDVKFLHYLIIYLMSLPRLSFDETAQRVAIKNEKTAAKLNDLELIEVSGKEVSTKSAALNELTKIKQFFENFRNSEIDAVLDYQLKKVSDPKNRYANIVIEKFGVDYVQNGLSLAKQYQNNLIR